MKVLLIGFGDIASRLASRLVDSGSTVTGLRRSGGGVEDIQLVAGDCRDTELLEGLLTGQDAVVVTLTPGEFSEQGYRDSYIAGAESLVAALQRLPVKPATLLWVSSTSVYGQNHDEWVDETSDTQPRGFSGQCLLAAERIISAGPVPATIVRFSGIYGPGRGRLLDGVRAGRCVPSQPVKWTNRIHSDDCAGVLEHLLAKARGGDTLAPLYLGTDSAPTPLHEVQHWLAARLGVQLAETEEPGLSRGNRRCSNALLLGSGYRFIYPGYQEGYDALLREMK